MAKRTDSKVDRKRKLEDIKRQQRSKERRKTVMTVIAAAVVGIALVGSVVGLSVKESRDKKAKEKAAAAAETAKVGTATDALRTLGVAASAASCSPTEDDKPIPKGDEHAKPGAKVDYKAIPPTGGQHVQQTVSLDQNFFAMGAADSLTESAVHDLEHGVVVAWYDKKLPAAEVAVLKAVAARTVESGRRFLVMPWQRGDLPSKPFYLSAWGHKQGCGQVSGEAILKFLDTYEDTKGDAPEAGSGV